MPKALNRDHLHYISPEEWRTLTAIEMGMKNHNIVPLEVVLKISNCKRGSGSIMDIIKNKLIPAKLVAFEISQIHNYKGYRLTNNGYDYLAIHALMKAGFVSQIGSIIGAGKESDIYLCVAGENTGDISLNEEALVVVKFHRLGRISFRNVKNKREYTKNNRRCSWLYLDRLAAHREYETIQKLYNSGLDVPRPIANNRNAVVMEYIDKSLLLSQVLPDIFTAEDSALARHLFECGKKLLHQVVEKGLIHGDFNEFNLLVLNMPEDIEDEDEFDPENTKLVLIDFPQVLSRDHKQAQEIYSRDRDGLVNFFSRYFDIDEEDMPIELVKDIPRKEMLDIDLKVPGCQRRKAVELKMVEEGLGNVELSDGEEDEETSEEEDLSSQEEDLSSQEGEEEVNDEKVNENESVSAPSVHVCKAISADEAKQCKIREFKKNQKNISCKTLKKQIRSANKQRFKKCNSRDIDFLF